MPQPFQAHQRFGQYTLVRPIAVGGMAEVWLAKLDGPKGFEKKIALKRMTAALAEQHQFVAMFLDEARLMSSLTHPHICQVLELGERDEAFYVAMEFIDGQTVHNLMRTITRRGDRLPLELAVQIVRDAADALAYAHQKTDDKGNPLDIIHRDVSPQNLMVTYEGVTKLVDFGIAKAATRSTATESGQLRGKLSYMPPEQARGEELDPRADQFSLGVTLFEMVTHTRLYRVMKDMDLFREVATGTEPYPTAVSRDPNVPDELSELIAKMMSRDRDQRFASMGEVRDKLSVYLHGLSNSLPSNQQLAIFMQHVFPPAEREKEQTKVLNALTPSSSSPGPTGSPVVGKTMSGRAKQVAIGGALSFVLVSALAAAFMVTPATTTPPPPTPPPQLAAVTPAPAPPPLAPVATVAPLDAGAEPALDDEPEEDEELDEEPAPLPNVPDSAKAKKKPRRAPKAKGKLSLTTTPWSIVYFGKRSLGETPLANVPLPVGKHRLKLVNDEKKLTTTIEVEIKPNQTTSLKLKL